MRNKKVFILLFICFLVAITCKVHPFYVREVHEEVEGADLEHKKQWTKILKGMPAEQIKDILGAPERVIEGVTTVWYYQKGGSVEFSSDKVIKWVKPYTWDY